MGNEQSAPYEGPTEVLDGRDVRAIVKYMKSRECRKVFVMVRHSLIVRPGCALWTDSGLIPARCW